MVQATPAPKPRLPKLLFIPYIYALVLIVLAIAQLMGMGGFDFAGIKYQTMGLPAMIVTIAGLEIFALPFVLRLRLSPAARFFSAVFSLAVPLFYTANKLHLESQGIITLSVRSWAVIIGLFALSFSSFYILNGLQSANLVRRKKT